MDTPDTSPSDAQGLSPTLSTVERLKLMAEDVRLRGTLKEYPIYVPLAGEPRENWDTIDSFNDAEDIVESILDDKLNNSKDRMGWHFLKYIAEKSDIDHFQMGTQRKILRSYLSEFLIDDFGVENNDYTDLDYYDNDFNFQKVDKFLTELVGAAPENSAKRLALLESLTVRANIDYSQFKPREDEHEELKRALDVIAPIKNFPKQEIDTFVSAFFSLQSNIRIYAQYGTQLFHFDDYERLHQGNNGIEQPEKTTLEKIADVNEKINAGIDDPALAMFADHATTLDLVSNDAEQQLNTARQALASLRNAQARVDADGRALQRPRLNGPQLDEAAAPHGQQLDDRNRDVDVRGI